MHNVGGYIALARDATREERQGRYDELKHKLTRRDGQKSARNNQGNRHLVTRMCLVEIADGIAATGDGPDAWQGRNDGGVSVDSGPNIDQIEAVADLFAHSIWPEIRTAIDQAAVGSELVPSTVRKKLAQHVWCDLIVGIIQIVEESVGMVETIQENARDAIVRAVENSSMQKRRPDITHQVVTLVVGRAWSVISPALKAALPPLNLDIDNLLRVLRILAVVICPAPGEHMEVREHALRPLGDDIRGYLTIETKHYLGEIFAGWPPPSDPQATGTGQPRPSTAT